MNRIDFVSGTIELREVDDTSALPESCVWDPRTECWRAPACAYAEVVMSFVRRKVSYDDHAGAYERLDEGLKIHRTPRPYQQTALDNWWRHRGQGVVVLPTGAGKTYVALMALDKVRRSTLVVAPTLELVRQWYDILRASFPHEVGVVGGGDYDVRTLTVTTYDSAYLHMDHFGDRFGLVVFDECHHLPGDAYSMSALNCLAPFRLGLSATPERADGRHHELDGLIGPIVCREEVGALAGDFLAEYTTERVVVELSPEERAAYDEARAIYRSFVMSQGIRMSQPDGWAQFIQRSARSDEGRAAMAAYQRQRRLAFAADSKLEYVEHLLRVHRKDRVLLFTQDNDTAYRISQRFLVPIITHQTKVTERSALLAGFAEGIYGTIVTSKVLNEGVDVPDANVAVVISGSGSVREHVQRLGRILRKKGDKQATLYELVAGGTSETFTSERRRDHNAYR